MSDPRTTVAPMTENASHDSSGTSSDTEMLGAPDNGTNSNLEKDPSDWVSGDDPATEAQKSYLDTLARQAGEQIPADLTKAEASQHIDRLRTSQSGQSGQSDQSDSDG